MQFQYRVVFPLAEDRANYIQLHHELFKSAAVDDEWLEWYHKDICESDKRLSNTRTYGVFDGERLIGIWSVEPKMFRDSNGSLLKVGRCFAVGVSSDYRRMGLFVSLSEYAIKCEKQIGEFEYILGFPQTGRSVIGGHLKAGWKEVAFFDIESYDLEVPTENYSLKKVDNICDFSDLTNTTSAINSFDEPLQYKNIRYLEHPKLRYMYFRHKDAFVVLKHYSSFCHIVDLQGDEESVLYLLEICKSVSRKHGFDEVNIWSSAIFKYKNALSKAGFLKGAKHGLPVTLIAVSINADKDLSFFGEMNLGMGVEEGY